MKLNLFGSEQPGKRKQLDKSTERPQARVDSQVHRLHSSKKIGASIHDRSNVTGSRFFAFPTNPTQIRSILASSFVFFYIYGFM